MNDNRTIALVAGVLALLSVATAVGQFLKRHPDRGLDPAAIRTFNNRLRGWWILCTVLAAAFWLGTTATVVLFGLVSFWALREFITLTPTRKGDHRALFWVFFLFTPLHYVLVGLNRYDVFSVFLPVYATLFVLARVAFAGDYKRFLERTAKIQAGLVVCVYCLSFAPALLQIPIPGAADADRATHAYRLATARAPRTAERDAVVQLVADSRTRLRQGELKAGDIAFSSLTRPIDLPADATPIDLAAWTIAARVILNLDETLTKN